MSKWSIEEQQELISQSLPGYVVEANPEPAPQADTPRRDSGAEEAADPDSLYRMYSGSTTDTGNPSPGPGRSWSMRSSPDVGQGASPDYVQYGEDDPDTDVVTVGGQLAPDSYGLDSRGSGDDEEDEDEVAFIPVRPQDESTDRGHGPGRKVIIATRREGIRGLQG